MLSSKYDLGVHSVPDRLCQDLFYSDGVGLRVHRISIGLLCRQWLASRLHGDRPTLDLGYF